MPDPRSPVAVSADDARILALERPDPNLLWLYGLTSLLALIFAPIVFVPLFFKYHTLRYKLDAEGVSVLLDPPALLLDPRLAINGAPQ